MQDTNIRWLSCYAVLKAGFTGDNYLYAHMRLVIALIAKKEYTSVEAKTLIEDFPKEYGYNIDYFAMRQILNLAISKGLLQKKKNRNVYYPPENLDKNYSLESELNVSKNFIRTITLAFQDFAHNNNVDYSEDEANRILFAYISTHKLNHISGRIDDIIHDGRVDHLFGKYVVYLRENSRPLFDHLTTIVTGSILADFLTFEENVEHSPSLEDVTFVFDTSVVFMALGLDVIDRQRYYKSLIDSIKKRGARVAIFRHTYDEMQQIILGAADWMNNYLYEPLYASDVAVYFHDKGASREDVLEYSTNLKQKLIALGFESDFLDADYNDLNRQYQISESEFHQRIVEQYKASNPRFDDKKKSNSVDLDVKSISLIYLLRKNANPVSIADSKYLFVTANRTLNKAAFDFHSEIGKSSKTIPASVTDVFLGTFIWLGDPIQITQMSEQRMLANAYLAFQPTPELIEKLSKTVEGLLASGEIDLSTYYTLKSNRYVLDRLTEKTLGDPDAYEESTPVDILREVREEGKREGILESEKKYTEQFAAQKEENEEKLRLSNANNRKLIDELLHSVEETKAGKERQRVDNRKRLKNANRFKTALKIFVAILYIALIICIVYGVYRLAKKGQEDSFDHLGVALTVIPLASQAIITLITTIGFFRRQIASAQ